MPVRITATLVSRRLSSTILALRSPLGARCLRSDQAITFRATIALRRDTAQAAAKRKTMVRTVSICYNLSFYPRYRQGSRCHKPPSESLPRLYLIDFPSGSLGNRSDDQKGLLGDAARDQARSEAGRRRAGVLHN